MIPSDLLFSGIKRIVYYTPIPYIYDIPTKQLMGEGSVYQLGLQGVWICAIGILYAVIYNKCVVHNLEYGG